MKLWVDDLRRSPMDWTWAKNFDEAIEYLALGEVKIASLDHDLGYYEVIEIGVGVAIPAPGAVSGYDESAKTGYDIVKWMAEHNIWPKELMTHTANPVGSDNMFGMIKQFGPYEYMRRFINPENHTKGLHYFGEQD